MVQLIDENIRKLRDALQRSFDPTHLGDLGEFHVGFIDQEPHEGDFSLCEECKEYT